MQDQAIYVQERWKRSLVMHRSALSRIYEQGFEMPQLFDRVCPTVWRKSIKFTETEFIIENDTISRVYKNCFLLYLTQSFEHYYTSFDVYELNDTQSQSQHSISQYY